MIASGSYPLLKSFPNSNRYVVAFGSPATLRCMESTEPPLGTTGTLINTPLCDIQLLNEWKQPTALATSPNLTDVAVTSGSGITSLHRMMDGRMMEDGLRPGGTTENQARPLAVIHCIEPNARGSALSWSGNQPTSLLIGYEMAVGHVFNGHSIVHYNVETGAKEELEASTNITGIAHVPRENQQFVYCSKNDFIQLWDMRSRNRTTFNKADQGSIYCLAFSPIQDRAFVTCTPPRDHDRSHIYFWDVRQTTSYVTTAYIKNKKMITQLLWGSDNKTLFAVPEEDRVIQIMSVDAKFDTCRSEVQDMGYDSFTTDSSSGRRSSLSKARPPTKKKNAGPSLVGLRTVTVDGGEGVYGIQWAGPNLVVATSQRGDVRCLTVPEAPPVCSWKGGPAASLMVVRGNFLFEVSAGPCIGSRMRQRIELGFATSPEGNAAVCTQVKDWNAVLVFHWLSKMLQHSNILNPVPDAHFVGIIAALSDTAYGISDNHRRHFILQMSCWEDTSSELSSATTTKKSVTLVPSNAPVSAISVVPYPASLLTKDEILERKVFIAVVQGKIAEATTLLSQKADNQYLLLSALLSSGAKPPPSVDTAGLSRYLGAIVKYLTMSSTLNSAKILEGFQTLPLVDRIGLAVTRISDVGQLSQHLKSLQDEAVKVCPLLGIIFAGLTAEGACFLQDYVNLTSDVQLAVAVGCYASRRFLNRFEIWNQAYRTWCNQTKHYMHRARFDIDVLRIQQLTDVSSGPTGEKPRSRTKLTKPTTVVRCSSCGQQLHQLAVPVGGHTGFGGLKSSPGGVVGAGGSSGLMGGLVRVKSQCPNPACRKPLPSCAICHQTMDNSISSSSDHQSWFLWCARCQHGGHAGHMLKWFSTNNVCPVEPCQCNCSTLMF